MVEGPGCKVKGETMKPRIRGQVVLGVAGSAVKKHIKDKKPENKNRNMKTATNEDGPVSPFRQLIGATVCDVQTLGKELFVFFTDLDVCIRVHFLMSGGFRLNGKKIDGEGGGEADTPMLLLVLNKDRLAFNNSSCDIMNAVRCHQKISEFLDLDICYESFNHKRALEIVLKQKGRMACDVLLDQNILPGVGNIIKNEALFDSGVKPDTKIEELGESMVSFLIKMTRDFSMVFYKCRRDHKPLQPYLKIYRKPKCKQCGSQVVTTRMGEVNGRLTSFCPHCQNNDPTKLHKHLLPAKNSLLGWVSSSVTAPTEGSTSNMTTTALHDWSCSQCTLFNKSTRSNCQICFTPKEKLWSGISSQTTKSHTIQKLPNQNPVILKDDISMSHGRHHSLSSIGIKRSSDCDASGFLPKDKSPKVDLSAPPAKRQKIGKYSTNQMASSPNNSQTQASPTDEGNQCKKVLAPVCTQHRRPCIMRQVHKQGSNLHRMFYSCPVGKGCNFFTWADEGFPICDGHGKRTVLRTVLKQGSNNGRKFFACSLNKNKQCTFFQWADQY